jgi:hypothetical protein
MSRGERCVAKCTTRTVAWQAVVRSRRSWHAKTGSDSPLVRCRSSFWSSCSEKYLASTLTALAKMGGWRWLILGPRAHRGWAHAIDALRRSQVRQYPHAGLRVLERRHDNFASEPMKLDIDTRLTHGQITNT